MTSLHASPYSFYSTCCVYSNECGSTPQCNKDNLEQSSLREEVTAGCGPLSQLNEGGTCCGERGQQTAKPHLFTKRPYYLATSYCGAASNELFCVESSPTIRFVYADSSRTQAAGPERHTSGEKTQQMRHPRQKTRPCASSGLNRARAKCPGSSLIFLKSASSARTRFHALLPQSIQQCFSRSTTTLAPQPARRH